ncbi:MAG: nitroreductase [Minwuia sp.]|nr:nitroreductase [Minwuia sp.]
MDALDLIVKRASVPPRLHEDSDLDDAALDQIFAATVTAPDHGLVRPYRFITIRGAARNRLGDVFAEAALMRNPDAEPGVIEKDRLKPLRSPVVVAVIACITPDHPKAPPVEQMLTAGMAGYNMVLAAQAIGLGGIWLTGAPTYDAHVQAALGVQASEELLGFVYLGQPKRDFKAPRRPDWRDFVTSWDE